MTRPFLTANWRYLAMLNYVVDPALLQPYVPRGTELDSWNGRTYASIVGFLFQDTRLLGVPIPGHRHFEELNLRFYVRRRAPDGWRRGVVFIKEIVPRRAIADVARLVYNEAYVALPMRHYESISAHGGVGGRVSYGWRTGRWNGLTVQTIGEPRLVSLDSEAAFITEHYWGYVRQRDGGTVEYQVAHPRWRIWAVSDYLFDCDVAALYGSQFVRPLAAEPTSIFLAEGSAVTVHQGQSIDI